MFQNKILWTFGACLLIGIIILNLITVSGNQFYANQTSVDYDQVLSSDTPTVYYYYQDTCHYCDSIKGELEKFTDVVNQRDELNFALVDMQTNKNAAAWYDWDAHNEIYGEGSAASDNPNYITSPTDMHNIDDIKISGTPTMIYVKDNQVVDYQIGADVFTLLDAIIEEFNLDISLDASVYGQGV